MENSFCCNSICGHWITTKFFTCHDSTAVSWHVQNFVVIIALLLGSKQNGILIFRFALSWKKILVEWISEWWECGTNNTEIRKGSYFITFGMQDEIQQISLIKGVWNCSRWNWNMILKRRVAWYEKLWAMNYWKEQSCLIKFPIILWMKSPLVKILPKPRGAIWKYNSISAEWDNKWLWWDYELPLWDN